MGYTSAVKRNSLEGSGATNLQKDAESPLVLSNLLLYGFRGNLPCLGEDSLSGILNWMSKNVGGTDCLILEKPLF